MQDWNEVTARANGKNPPPPRRVEKTETQWRELLQPEQFETTRHAATERPFSSEMCAIFEPGIYRCVCCGTELFDAGTKFESGTGWPSFTQPLQDNLVAYRPDDSMGKQRIEALCSVCDAHLGHVFPDGPPPTGLRFCMNALALQKKAEA